MEVRIKNMVCPRCIEAVAKALSNLDIPTNSIELGRVELVNPLSEEKKKQLTISLNEKGFELLESKESKLIGQIKTIIIEQIHYNNEPLNINFSTLLSEKLHQDYQHLSRLFSSVEGLTLEQFIILQKVERIKELLSYDELSISEIALRLNYSSTAYLSAQFKKVTGWSPSEFRQQKDKGRKFLDDL